MTNNKLRRRLRLELEQKWLEKYYNGEEFPWHWEDGMAVFERNIKTSRNNNYKLGILVGENYPQQLPDLVVFASPKPMPESKEWQGAHETHTRPRKPDGLLRICHYRLSCWKHENKLYQVFEKGEQWLEAYDEHLETGQRISELLPTMEPTEEERREEEIRRVRFERFMTNMMRRYLAQSGEQLDTNCRVELPKIVGSVLLL